MKTIMILKDIFNPQWHYLIDAIALRWEKIGYKVITHYGTKNLPGADIVILHVDTTIVPDEYVDCLSKYPVVLNRNVLNISKTMISQTIVHRDEDYSGPVIIKTNANFGGVPEYTLKRISQRKTRWSRLLLKTNRYWETVDVLNPYKYPIFKTKACVPVSVWGNKNLIVEKFLPEKVDGLFFVRYWIFFGDKGYACRFGGKGPIVKFRRMVTKHEPVSVPNELRLLRDRLGFDYGRFDYLEHDGKTVLCDVNKTVGGASHYEDYSEELDLLASGINGFLSK